MDKSILRAIAVLSGTVIGAGIFGIPYIISKAGFLVGLLTLLFLGFAVLMLNLFLGEVILRTPGNHQLPGYARKYLGKWGKRFFVFSMFFAIYGAMIAYLIGWGRSLSAIFGGNPLLFSLIFFVLASTLIYAGIKSVSKSEVFFVGAILFLILIISFMAFFSGRFDVSNFYNDFNLLNLIIPYGVVLFAFVGMAAIPEMKECLIRDRKSLKKAIIIGSLIPLFVYILFAFVTIGITGMNTTEIATIGLGQILGKGALIFGNVLAVIAMFTSFLTLAIAMKEIYIFDYGVNRRLAFVLTIFIPLIIFLSGAKDFIKIIGITGALAGSLDGILIVLMFWMAKKKGGRIPEYNLGKKRIIGAVLILLFIFGLIYTLIGLL